MRIRRGVAVLLLLQGQEVVGGHTLDNVVVTRQTSGLNDSSDTDLVLLNHGGRRDGVVPRLELVDTFDDQGERNSSERLRRDGLQGLGDVEALVGDLLVEVILVATETNDLSLGLLIGSKGGQSCNELTGHGGADFQVVAESGIVGRGSGNGNLGSNIQALDVDDRVALFLETENLKSPINLDTGVGGPHRNVITGLVGETASSNADFHVQTVPILDVEQFARLGNGGDKRVVGREGSLGLALEVALGGFTQVDLLVVGGGRLIFGHGENGFIDRLAFFQVHGLGQSRPHGFLPGQKVFFHGTGAIVTFTGRPHTLRAQLGEGGIDVTDHGVVVLVSVVTQAKSDVLHVRQGLVVADRTALEGDIITGNKLVEIGSVVGGLTLTIGGDNEEGDLILGEGVQLVVVVVLEIGHHGLEAKTLGTFLGQTRGVVLGGSGLGAVENHTILASLVHFLHDVPGFAGFGGPIGSRE